MVNIHVYFQVAGRVLDKRYEKAGKDINTIVNLDSDIYNPVYDHRVEIREPNIPPTATLLLKVRLFMQFAHFLDSVHMDPHSQTSYDNSYFVSICDLLF